MDILDFKQLIVALAIKSVSKPEDREDLIQDLWLKIIELDTSLLPENRTEAFKFMKTVFSNYIKNWRRGQVVCESIDEFLLSEILSVKETMTNQVETVQLLDEIQKWSKRQSTDIQTVLTELITPSPLVLEILHNCKLRKRNCGYLPPYKVINIFGINPRIWRKSSQDLHRHLQLNSFI